MATRMRTTLTQTHHNSHIRSHFTLPLYFPKIFQILSIIIVGTIHTFTIVSSITSGSWLSIKKARRHASRFF